MTSARRELILSMAFFCFLEEALISQSSEGEDTTTTSNERTRSRGGRGMGMNVKQAERGGREASVVLVRIVVVGWMAMC